MPAPQASLSDIWKLKILADIRPGGNMERVTFTRTGVASYFKHDGTVGSAATGILRVEWLKDPVSGILQPYYKLEAAATNSCLQSQALATTWTANLLTATNNSGGSTAPDGTSTATSLVPTAVSSAAHYVTQGITITSAENLAASIFIKAGAYSGARFWFSDTANGGLNGFFVAVDLTAGTIVNSGAIGAGSLTGSTIIALSGGWYWVGMWGKVNGGITAGIITVTAFDTGAHANTNTAFTGDAVSGIYGWGTQLERNGVNALPPTSYIATTTITVARNTDSFSVPYFVGPNVGAQWIYLRGLERGGAALSGNGVPLQIGSSAAGNPRFLFDGTGGGYRGIHQEASGTITSQLGTPPTFGQAFELLLSIFADGSVQARQSINGAADTVGALSAALAPATQFANPVLYLNSAGSLATSLNLFSRVLVGLGAGTTVQQISDVRGIP